MNIKRMPFQEAWPHMEPMATDHCIEVLGYPSDPDLEQLNEMSDAGNLLTYVLFDESDTAIGYCMMYIAPFVLAKNRLQAIQLALYVIPEARRGLGRALVAHVDKELKPHVTTIFRHARPDTATGRVYESLHYRHTESTYTLDSK